MKFFIVLLLVLLPRITLAKNLPKIAFSKAQNETIFSTLKSWYEDEENQISRNVKWSEMKGSYSGRCYFINQPDTPYPGLLTYVPSADDGPAFPAKLPLMLEVLQWTDSSKTIADYDGISAKQVKSFQDYMRKSLLHYGSGLTEEPTVSQKFDIEPNNRPDYQEDYRLHKDGYILNRSTNLITQNLSLPSGNVFVKANEAFCMCYFFKQVGE